MNNARTKTVGIILASIASLFVMTFLYFFVSYSWQLKYGDTDNINQLTRTFGGGITSSGTRSNIPVSIPDYRQFIRNDNPTIGAVSAPITILMFIDFQCPFCQASFPILKEVMSTYDSAVRVVFKHYPITSIHPDAFRTAQASMCAYAQGRFWEFHDAVFSVRALDESSLYTYAGASSINLLAFERCMQGTTYDRVINQDLEDGLAIGVRGTPTYLVNGRVVEGSPDIAGWQQLILEELNKQ